MSKFIRDTHGSRNALAALLLALSVIFVPSAAHAQSLRPISKDALLKALRINGLSTAEFVQQIERRGVDFKMTSEVESEFLAISVRPEVIEAVRVNYRPSVPVAAPVAQKSGEADKLAQKGAEYLRKTDWLKAAENYRKAVRADPKHFEANYGLGVAHMGLRQFTDALAAFSEVVRLRPNPRVQDALRNTALIYYDQQRFKESAENFEQALQLGDIPPSNQYFLGLDYMRLERGRDAINAMSRAVSDAKYAPDAYFNSGVAHFALGEKPQAVADLEKALSLSPGHALALIYLGGAYITLERYEEAFVALKKGTTSDPRQPLGFYWLGVALDALYKYTDAALALEASLRLQPQNTDAQFYLGIVYTHLNRYTEAMPLFEQVMRAKPDAPEPLAGMCTVYYSQGNYMAMLTSAQQAARLAPQSATARTMLAIAYAGPGMMKEALAEAREAVRLEPGNYWPHLTLGFILVRSDRAQEALAESREAVRLSPNRSSTLSLLGYVLNQVGQNEEALSASQRALAAPHDPSEEGLAHYNIATAYFNMKRTGDALEAYRRSLSAYQQVKRALDPDELYLMGTSYLRLDQDELAVSAFRQATKIRPTFTQAHYNLGVAYVATEDRKSAMEEYNALKRLDPARAAKLLAVINDKPARRQ